MKVLFIRSGNVGNDSISGGQALSLKKKEIDVEFFSIKGKGFWGYSKNIFLLRKKIREVGPDILHAHYGWSGIVAYIACSGQKIITSFMGDDIVGTNRKDGSITLISKLLVRINVFFARNLYDHSIAKSEEIFYRIKGKRVTLIPNGVDLKVFYFFEKKYAREIIGKNGTKKIIIFVSDPSRVEKNYELAINAIKLLNDTDILLLDLYDKSPEELVYFYNAADLLLLTSFHEGSPNVVKEAMACNCPVVATNVGDIKWLFGKTSGYFISSFEPEDVAEKIKLAIEYRKESNQTKGRDRIIELCLDAESIADKLIIIYKKILKG